MKDVIFSWDDKKAKNNLTKHKVTFNEASTVFFDENAIEFYDPEHSVNEDRYLMLGISSRLRIIVVSYCTRKSGMEIRIISARRATKNEQSVYLERKL
jgi:uncharacterized DUF497 family protein